jgi:hypothetical protein
MKVIEFIKRNISVFNVIALFIFLFFIKLLINTDLSSCKGPVIFIFLFLSIIFLMLDFVTKILIKSRLKLNILQFVILIILSILFYLKIYN